MKYRSSVDTSLEILLVLAVEKEYAQYDMPKAVGKDYRTVLRHLQALEQYGFIALARTEQAKKNGKDRKIYTLTLQGLSELMGVVSRKMRDQVDVDSLTKIAGNFKHLLPLVFGKWEFFMEHGVRNVVVERLVSFFYSSPSMLQYFEQPIFALKPFLKDISILKLARSKTKHPTTYVDKKAKRYEKALRGAQAMIKSATGELKKNAIQRYVLFQFEPEKAAEFQKLLSVIMKDSELRAFILSELESSEKYFTTCLQNTRALREHVNSYSNKG